MSENKILPEADFQLGDWCWHARYVMNEANTRYVLQLKLTNKRNGWPSREQYRAAYRHAENMLVDKQTM